jgi:L-alanine-DL-glutamate epimerase-like enolase superfamily enzyme
MNRELTFGEEVWPLKGRFAISRGAKTESRVIVARLTAGGRQGWGECVPYPRYGESIASVLAQIDEARRPLEQGADRMALLELLPPGAARNALDCALWDLEAKLAGRPAHELAGLTAPRPVVTAYTLGLDSPLAMAQAAAEAAGRPLLKIKLGRERVLETMTAIRAAAPAARLIVDANEAWTAELHDEVAPSLARLGVELIEQPLPAAEDAALAARRRPVPVCADESCHVASDLPALLGRYDAINVKLDKTGGLTAALALVAAAKAQGLTIMVGCMIGTSLAMAPACLIANKAKVVDLDGPLLLARDRDSGLNYADGCVHPPDAALWG